VLLALLVVVAVTVVVNRQFATLAGRIAVLEAGWSCSVVAGSPPTDVVIFIDAAA
jgi:hypothetical protein